MQKMLFLVCLWEYGRLLCLMEQSFESSTSSVQECFEGHCDDCVFGVAEPWFVV